MSELGGLWDRLPLFAFFLILASLGSAAVPGLNGFVGEFPILTGAFARDPFTAILGTLGMILGAWYLLWMLQRLLFGPLREPHAHGHGHGHAHGGHGSDGHHDAVRPVAWHEIAGLTPLMVLIVIMGVYPRPFFDRLRPATTAIAQVFEDRDRRARENAARALVGSVEPEAVRPRAAEDVPPTPGPLSRLDP